MVSSSCQFKKPVAYPDALEAGVRVARIGARSVTYEVGIFMENDAQAAAHGELVHVFVDRATESSTPIPPGIREALERITV